MKRMWFQSDKQNVLTLSIVSTYIYNFQCFFSNMFQQLNVSHATEKSIKVNKISITSPALSKYLCIHEDSFRLI